MAKPTLLEYDVKSQIHRYLVDLKRRNPRLSLRALARRTGINPTSLSLFLNGKRELSPANCRRLLVLMNSEDRGLADDATLVELGRSRNRYVEPTSADRIRLLSHWLPMAVLSYLETADADADAGAIARRLHVQRPEAQGALEVLERLGLVTRAGDRLQPTGAALTGGTVRGASDHVRKTQLACLERSAAHQRRLQDGASSSLPFNFSVLIAAADSERIERAKQEIVRFRRRMEKILQGSKLNEVYMLSVDLLPLTPRYTKTKRSVDVSSQLGSTVSES